MSEGGSPFLVHSGFGRFSNPPQRELTSQSGPGGTVIEESQSEQRRQFPRRRVEAAVAVCGVASSTASRTWRGHALNVSEGGAGIIVAGPWLPGQVVRLEIAFGGAEQTANVIARVAHRNRLYCGLQFLGNEDRARAELRSLLAG
ncbi:MAG: PilZ domain-containing protein [Terriglobales bacterium]